MIGAALLMIAGSAVLGVPIADASPARTTVASAFIAGTVGCADYAEHGIAPLTARYATPAVVPEYVTGGAADTQLGKPHFFQVPAQGGDIWVITFDADPLCFVQAYGPSLKSAEADIRAGAVAAGWARDAQVRDVVRGMRVLNIFDTTRGGRRVQLVLLTPRDYAQAGSRPVAISGYVQAVEKGK